MKKLTIPLTLLAAATLAACAGHRDLTQVGTAIIAPTATTTAAAPRPGFGKVVELVDPTGPVDGITTQRMTLRMEDGSTQVVEQRGHQVALGERVQIRPDNSIRRERLAWN